MSIAKATKLFKAIVPTINPKYRAYAEQVIKLFADRKIEKTKEAEKLLTQLSGRGVAPQTAIKKIGKRVCNVSTVCHNNQSQEQARRNNQV